MKVLRTIFVVLITVLFLSGCDQKNSTLDDSVQATAGDKITVVTSIYPMYDFAHKISGDKAHIINLLNNSDDAHHFELSPDNLKVLESADIFIYSGLLEQNLVDKLKASLTNEELLIVNASEGLELISIYESQSYHENIVKESDKEDLGSHSKEDMLDSHENEEEHDEHGHDFDVDPHTWLSLENAVLQLEIIKSAFIDIDSTNADFYETNFEKYKVEFNKLNEKYAAEFEKHFDKIFVSVHSAFKYLARDYNLRHFALTGFDEEYGTDPSALTDLIQFINDNHINTIFYEQSSNAIADVIVRETDVKKEILHVMEFLTIEQEDNKDDYLSIMETNLQTLALSLSQ